MRLFIAIQLSPEMKAALTETQDAFRRQGVRGNYTPAENLHMTLAFIGEYPDPDRVLEVMDETLGGEGNACSEELRLKLSGIGAFGDLWWAGTAEHAELKALVQRFRRALAEADIPYDRKKFSPHVTLVRRAVFGRGFAASEIRVPKAEMTVERVSLMLSTRGKRGMIYTELGTTGLQRNGM